MRLSLPAALLAGCTAALLLQPAATATPSPKPQRREFAGGGSTTTLPLPAGTGLAARGTRPFELLGLGWDGPADALAGAVVRVRTRNADTGRWSAWHRLEAGPGDSPDDPAHGATAPLWTGRSDGVAVEVRPGPAGVPAGLRLDLVDPGNGVAPTRVRTLPAEPPTGPSTDPPTAPPTDPPVNPPTAPTTGSPTGSPVNPPTDPTTGSPANPPTASPTDPPTGSPVNPSTDPTTGSPANPSTDPPTGSPTEPPANPPADVPTGPSTEPTPKGRAPRPAIVTRAGWGADESLRERDFVYTGPVREVFVHHTDTATDYACADAPRVIRAMYQYHVKTNGWRDIGYNFLVDRCGTVYEGRAGGVERPVQGAHTLGFNADSSGIAAIGTYVDGRPPQPLVDSLAALAAWKLGLEAQPADGRTKLTSSSGASRYPKGSVVEFDAVSGHRDAVATECPGNALYALLPALRTAAALLQTR
ncbi:N-acetylmuramoyl-L-alanine amidase [Kitasatospora sp. NPDC058048]|uniref:peptidoglycan recognition protein family protein n=1 Tax=Kitasatospora sp. NPDC058048 TaxID=3346313 RepID=UPI0036DAF0C7